jgi:hypothetical protein
VFFFRHLRPLFRFVSGLAGRVLEAPARLLRGWQAAARHTWQQRHTSRLACEPLEPRFLLSASASGGVEGMMAATLTGATFTDSHSNAPGSDFTITSANWGDGSTATMGLMVSGTGTTYTVSGSHLYGEEGQYTFSINVEDAWGGTATITGSATVADAHLTGSTMASAIDGVAGVTAASLSAATFSDVNTAAPTSDFTVTAANWGDGSTATTGLTVSGSNGNYAVSGSHLYGNAGRYNFSITVADDGGATATITGSTTVAYPLTGHAVNLDGALGLVTAQVVATFTDANPNAVASNYAATINWGDGTGTTSATSIQADPKGGFDVIGQHAYSSPGDYQVRAALRRHQQPPAQDLRAHRLPGRPPPQTRAALRRRRPLG